MDSKEQETPNPLPTMGRIVLYKGGLGYSDKQLRPAIINHVYPDDPQYRVSMVVFAPTGVFHFDRVRYSAKDTEHDTWRWPSGETFHEKIDQANEIIDRFMERKNASTSGEQQSDSKHEHKDSSEGRKAPKAGGGNSTKQSGKKQESQKT